jgi:hypothetical protein
MGILKTTPYKKVLDNGIEIWYNDGTLKARR